MSSDLATELSALRTLILTAKDDITHTREAYSHDALATHNWAHALGIVLGFGFIDALNRIKRAEVVYFCFG